MKKFFSFLLALTAAVAVNATVVDFDFTSTDELTALGIKLPGVGQGTNLKDSTLVKSGITMTFTPPTGSTPNRIYQGSGANAGKYDLRLYAGGAMILTVAGEDKINEVYFEDVANITNLNVGGAAIEAQKYSSVEGVTTVTFSASGSVTVRKISVKINEEVIPFVCNELDTLTVSDAVDSIHAESPYNSCKHVIVGVLDSIEPSKKTDGTPMTIEESIKQYGNLILWLRDADDPNDSIKAYQVYKGPESEKYVSINELEFAVGDTIYIYSSNEIMDYDDTKAGKHYPEINGGYYYGRIGESPRKVLNFDAMTVEPSIFGDEFEFNLSKEGTTLAVAFGSMTSDVESLVGSYTIPATTLTLEDGSTINLTSGTLEVAIKSMFKDTMNYTVVFVGNSADGKLYYSQFAYKNYIFVGDNTNITAAKAYEIAAALPSGGVTETKYYIYGYYGEYIPGKNNANAWKDENGKRSQTFWMADVPGTTKGSFEVYHGNGFNKAADTAKLGDYVYVKGCVLKNYGGNTPETGESSCQIAKVNVESMPKLLDVKAPEKTIAEAIALGTPLANRAKTPLYYTIKGFVKEITMDEADPTQVRSFTMAETADGEAGFTAYRCRTIEGNSAVNVGDEVSVRGAIKKYQADDAAEAIYEIEGGRMEILHSTALPEALIERSHKQVVKTVEDGQIVIIKNGVRYNLLGGAIR